MGQRPKIKGTKHFGQKISKSRIVVGSFESVLKVHKLCICDYVSCEIKIFWMQRNYFCLFTLNAHISCFLWYIKMQFWAGYRDKRLRDFLGAHDLLNSQNYSKNHIFGKSFWKLLRLVSDIELDTELDTELDIEQDIEQDIYGPY